MNLPYELSPGAWAHERGLRFDNGLLREFMGAPLNFEYCEFLLSWPDAAKQLCYREGEPWCWYWPEFDRVALEPSSQELLDDSIAALHRTAAILCDHTHAFTVLHECIERYGNGGMQNGRN